MREDLIYNKTYSPGIEKTVTNNTPPPRVDPPGTVYATRRTGNIITDFISKKDKVGKIKMFLTTLLIANTLLTTPYGMKVKKYSTNTLAKGLEYCIGEEYTSNVCTAASSVGKFVSKYVERTLTWIDYCQ